MDVPLEIAFRHMDTSPAVEARIREHVQKLERFFDHVTSCRVTVELVSNHHRKGPKYAVTVEANVPGQSYIVASSKAGEEHLHEDVYVAIRDAFNAARRQIQDYVDKVRGEVKSHNSPTDV